MKGAEKLTKALGSSDTIKKPVDKGIRRMALYYDGLVKKATVVDTGRLRSSITHNIGTTSAQVGTNVKYAGFVEYGTQNMAARHMEGSVKVLDEGMFRYAWGLLQKWLSKGKHNIHVEIDKEFKGR